MAEHSDVLVIGGGVIGVCTAYSLAERGIRPRLVERDEICSGCSHGNAGWVFPSHSMPIPAPGVIRRSFRWLADPKNDNSFYTCFFQDGQGTIKAVPNIPIIS